MAETSLFWSAIAYTDDQFSDFIRKLFTIDRTIQCVIPGNGGELAVTGTATPVTIATGAALVDGKLYENSTAVPKAISTPAASTRIDRIVLQKHWSNEEVTIEVVSGIEGGAAPSVTQSDGVNWQISLAQVSITTGGIITVTDERTFLYMPIGVPPGAVFYTIAGVAPTGYSEYTAAQGLYIVGLPSGGTNLVGAGTLLTDQENRAVGQHNHSITDSGHTHDIDVLLASGPSAPTIVGNGNNPLTTTTVTDAAKSKATGITIDNEGSVAGTNAPYIQLMAIEKD